MKKIKTVIGSVPLPKPLDVRLGIGLLVGVVVISILLLGEMTTAWTGFSPSNRPTSSAPQFPTTHESEADWRVYTNTKYGYSFRYPSSVDIGELGEEADQLNALWQALYLRLPSLYVEIIAHENQQKLTSLEYARRSPPHVSRSNEKEVTLAGREGFQFDFLEPRDEDLGTFVPTRVIFVSFGDRVLEFWVKGTSAGELSILSSEAKVKPTFADILAGSQTTARQYQTFISILSTLGLDSSFNR